MSSGAEVVFNTIVPPGLTPFLEQLHDAGFTKRGGQIVCTYFDENFLNLVPAEHVEGLYSCLDYYQERQRSVQQGAARAVRRALPGQRQVHGRQRVLRPVPRAEALGGRRDGGRLARAGGRDRGARPRDDRRGTGRSGRDGARPASRAHEHVHRPGAATGSSRSSRTWGSSTRRSACRASGRNTPTATTATGAAGPEPATQGLRVESDELQDTGTHDGFVTYDELSGPDLDAARWSPARLPLPTGGEHIPLDPNAELAVGEGEVRVTIPRFSLSHDTFQPADSAKYLIFSTRQFELPPDRPATFAVDLAVKNIGGEPADFRRGMAAFHVFDFDVSKRVFAVCGTSTRVLALHEQLGAVGRRRAVLPRRRVAVRGLRRRLHPASRVRDHARPEQIDRDLARRRPHGVRDPRHLHPRTRSHRVRDLDDAADPRRSQSLARRAGHRRPVAPVPRTRDPHVAACSRVGAAGLEPASKGS